MSAYIQTPQTPEECLSNVQFQADNITGWLTCNRENAAIKAQCLLEAAQVLVAKFEQEQAAAKRMEAK